MAFDPDAYLAEGGGVEETPFDPDAYLGIEKQPVGTSVEQEVSQLGAALKSGITQPLQAMGVTAETLGMPAVGAALKGAVEQPEGYVPAAQRFMEPKAGEAQLGGFAFQYLPRAIVEQVGQLAGSVASRAAGGVIGGAAGSVVPGAGTAVGAGIGMFTGPALFEAAQIVGPVAKERAKNNGREIPNSEDLAYAWTTAGTSGALNAIGAKYLPGGEKAVGALTKRIAASFLGEGATEGAQALAQQTGETILTEKGLEIQPKAALGEALIGGVSAGGATIVMSPLQKEQVDIEKEADLESRDLSVPVDDPEVRANLDKVNILEQENKDSLAIINKFGVESEEGKAAQQTIVDNADEIAKINQTLPTGLSLPITTAEQQQIELAKQIAAPVEPAPAAKPTAPKPLPTDVLPVETPGATYGRESEIFDVFAEFRRKPLTPAAEVPAVDVAPVEPAPPTAEAPAITPAPVAKTPAVAPAPEAAPTSWVAPEQKLTPQENRALQVANLKGTEKRTGNITFVPEKLMTPQRLQSLRTEKESSGPLKDFPRGGRFIEIKRMADVTGDPYTKGWAIIDRRPDLNRREWIAQIPNRDERILAGSIANNESEKIVSAIKDGSITQERSNQLVDEAVNNQIISSDFANNLRTAISNSTPAVSETITPTEPAGIAIGNRIKLGKSPQTYTIEEVIPQSATERELGEQYYSVENERTGEIQVVEAVDIKPVGGKKARRMASEIRAEEKATPVPEANRYTFEEAVKAVDAHFGKKGIPEGVVIVNNTTEPDLEMKAGYFVNRGQIVINLAYIAKGENLGDIIDHELGHYIFGDPEFQSEFKQFWELMTPEEKADADRIISQFYNKETGAVQMEEKQVRAFMQLIQDSKAMPKWKQILDKIKRWINEKLGTNLQVTDRGALAVLAAAHKRFKSGEQIVREIDSGVLKTAETAQDAEYLAAVERGDMETAQRMVDEAAKKAGYDVGPVWHGSPDFIGNEFDINMRGRRGLSRGGFSFTKDKAAAEAYMQSGFDPSQRLVDEANSLMRELQSRIDNGLDWNGPYNEADVPIFRSDAVDNIDEFQGYLSEIASTLPADLRLLANEMANRPSPEDYTANPRLIRAFLQNPKTINVAGRELLLAESPSQIKSADPVTYDDAGNVIPLSQRFRPTSPDIRRMAAEPRKPAEEKPTMERYKGKAQVAGVPGIGAEKDTPKGINKKTEEIIKDRVFNSTIVNDNQTKKAWNLIQKIEEKNPESGKNAQAINELTRETMQDVEADEVVKQSIGAVKLRNELYSYAIKLAGEGDPKMLNYLLNTRLSIGSGNIVEGDAGRLLQAMASLKSWIVRATEAEQQGFFDIAAQQFFGTKTPTDEQVQQIKNIFNKVKEVKIDQEKELMTELEDVGKAAGVDLPAVVQKELDAAPGLDPMVVAMTAMQKLYGGTITTQYEPISKRAQGRIEGVKKIIQGGISNYRQKIVSKAANGLETGFWKTLATTEDKPGPLGELDAAQNRALGNIVKQSLVAMGLKGTPPDTKMTIYEQVASILGEKPLSKDKIEMADEKIRGGIEAKRQAELENATEDQVDAINLKYDEMTIAWDEAMSRSLDMPVSDTMLRRMILNELKDADTSIQDLAKLMDEEPVIGTSRQDRLVNSIIEKVTGITFEGQLTRDYTNLKTYLSDLLENMVLARQQKNKAAKDVAKTKRDASGDPTKQAQAQIDKLAKIQADPTIFGEKRIDPVRNAVRDALSLQLNIGFTPEQSAKIKNNWKGAFVADPNKKGIPTSFMLELQRLGVSEAAANTLADIVWRQIEVNAMSRQMDATTKAVEAGPIGGIVQAILDTPLANQQDPEWRKNVILDYLKNAGVKPSQAENIAKLFDVSLRKRFAKAQEEAAIKAAKSIKGGLTTNSKRALEKFLKAIRAQVLDPGKDVAKAFAEEMGWKGFTTEQIVRLNELDAIVNDNEKTDAERAVATEQIQQIIDKVSMPPQVKEIMASFYIGNALMRFPTFAVQAFDPLAMTTFNTAIESFRNVTNPQQFIQTWANYGRAVSNLFRETAYSFKNDVLRSGRMIDYLENEDRKIKRLWNEAENKWKRGDIRGAMKDGIFGYTAWTFRTLKALDDGAYSLLTSTTLPQYVEAALKNAKIPREKRRGVMRQVLHAREMDIEQMVNKGIPKNDAVIYANERMQAAITKELSGLNIDAQEVINSAINDALARIGKTRFAEDILTGKADEIKDLGTISAPFLRWYESVSKAVSGKGSESQKIFYRILLGFPLIPARIFNIAAGYTPLTIYRHALKGRYQLTYGTALQRRQRLAEQLAGTIVLLPLLALRSNSLDEEDEKEKGFGVYITGQGPSKMKDKTLHAKWNDRHDPFSLEFRMGGKTKFAIDAKAAGPLSVMIYLLGAIDDLEINRKLDGLKTSKDDWKEAQDKASIVTSLYDLAGYAVLTTARRGPTTGVMQGLVDFRRFPDDPIAAIGADVAFSAMPAVPILGTGIAKNLSDFFSQPIDNTTKEGAILANIPIVGPIVGKPALNSYGQRLGELRVSEKLKKSFGVPFTLVVSDNEEDNKLTSLTLKFGDGPTPLRREDVENELKSAISDDEWYLAAKTFGDRNRSYVLKNYNRYEKMKPAVFSKVMSSLAKVSKANAISAVKKARRNNP